MTDTMTAAEYRKMKKRGNKYNARRVNYDGLTFHSAGERDRYKELRLLEKYGEIKELRLQVPFVVVPKDGAMSAVKYIADFCYMEKDLEKGIWEPIVEDFKSPATRKRTDYKIKKRLMRLFYGAEIRETGKKLER